VSSAAIGPPNSRRGRAGEVLAVFARLGVTSFGGPIAHLGYFREEFVVRRRWLDEPEFADLVALCQFLPGPASSQVGFSIGLRRAGYRGALAAWCGFTLPSAIALTLFAAAIGTLHGARGDGLLHGLRIVAVAIVAQAVWGMARTLSPDRIRASIATVAALAAQLGTGGQIAAIVAGALIGWRLCPGADTRPAGSLAAVVTRRAGMLALGAFFVLLAGLPLARALAPTPLLDIADAFYRAGALVFGGGHVVLPLLRDAVVTPGWVSDDVFLAGYGAAQAVPGPLFTFAAYLGAVIGVGPGGAAGAAAALAALFLPGLLVLVGTLPFWDALRRRADAQAAMRGINAAVVGVLAAALYNPVWTGAITAGRDFALALTGFVLLVAWRAPPLVVVLLGAVCGVAFSA
jgi:chromate transporter